MAGLVLAAAGSAIGGAIGGTFLGISAAVVGQTIGAVVGSVIDNFLFAPSLKSTQEGPRLQESQIFTSTEGQPIMRGYGRFRIPGNMIWATRFREEVVKETTTQGGKGGGSRQTAETTTYNYFVSFAVGLCEGEIQSIHRVWVDSKPLDLSNVTYRVYTGTETQTPDSLITTKEGSGNVPAYRGLAYVVFEEMQINDFGNRIPQMSFEITKPVDRSDNLSVGDIITGIDLIPGTTEFGYDPNVVEQVVLGGPNDTDVIERRAENNHVISNVSNWKLALDQMAANLPNLNVVTFVVTWFGDDLRIGECKIQPRVENRGKRTDPIIWTVAGMTRELRAIEDLSRSEQETLALQLDGFPADPATMADEELRQALSGYSSQDLDIAQTSLGWIPPVISQVNNRPAFGGSPNDLSVYRAILDLKARGYEIIFYPFIIMDIEANNTLPNPYSANGSGVGQAVYPWRGRITVNPAIGQTGTNDKTAAARTQVNNFLGSATSANFSGSGGTINFSGGINDWGFNRFILHMAEICRQAGGVEYFCIGTEMVGASIIRDQNNAFPFVDGLVSLAEQVNNLLPSASIGYAADWSEYHSHRPSDGTGDVYFHLDPLWSNANIDFIGIDNYLPLSDWRDGINHADYGEGNDSFGNPRGESIYDVDYLKGQIEGGEWYDYFYASAADRASQTRTAINDTAHGEHWVFANKRMKEWWQNAHHNRPGGVRQGSSTGWVPQSKKIIFTEYGAPAVNKGTNQPNVFFDPKSSESFVPHFSSGARDDEIQRQYIRAMVEYWQDNNNNPQSTQYSGRMIDTARFCYWSYDARPWPTFPVDGDTWADQPNWQFGHWISGRIDTVFLPDLLRELAEDYGLTASFDFSRAYGTCDGFLVQAKTSFRSTVEPLTTIFMFDIIESGGQFKAVSEQEVRSLVTLTLDDIAEAQSDQEEPIMLTRRQETELPASVSIRYIDTFGEYEPASVYQTREVVEASGAPATDTPIVLDMPRAQQMVDRLLYSAWAKRTEAEFGVLPQYLFLEAGDVVTLNAQGFTRSVRLETVADAAFRKISARSFDESIFETGGSNGREQPIVNQPVASAALFAMMDLPLLRSVDVGHQPYAASFVNPWPQVNVFKSITTSNFSLDSTLFQPSILGQTTAEFNPGVTDVWDNANELRVEIYSDTLSTLPEEVVLNNANSIAVENSTGGWEIVQFVNATLTGTRQYTLTRLLRGQLGTEDNMQANLPAGARIVVLDTTLQQLNLGLDDTNREYNYRYGPADRDIGDTTYITIQRTATGRGLKPFSPVHIRGTLAGGGDVTISWIRRTRVLGDRWEYTEAVPLGEAFEKYEVDILSVGGSTVTRTLSVTDATQVTYTNANRISDNLTGDFDVIVYQLSDIVGRGTGRRVTING